jgi:hypothetical protein
MGGGGGKSLQYIVWEAEYNKKLQAEQREADRAFQRAHTVPVIDQDPLEAANKRSRGGSARGRSLLTGDDEDTLGAQ